MRITKTLISIIVCIMLVISGIPMAMISVGATTNLIAKIDTGVDVTIADTDGDGFYEIGTADELYAFASIVNDGKASINAILTENITVNEGKIDGVLENAREWVAIGKNLNYQYHGKFNGNNKTISGLYTCENFTANNGLFGNIGESSEIKNVTVKNSYFSSHFFAGGIVGAMSYGTIENCSAVDVNINVEYSTAGGIVGLALDSDVKNCFATGKVLAKEKFGNIVGYSENSSIENCFYLDTNSIDSTVGEAKSSEQFASGEVAYLLGEAFGQKIGFDELPVLGGDKIYYGYESCLSTEKTYSNHPLSAEITHEYKNGICTVCGAYEPAVDSDGDGYHEINNAGNLYWFAEEVNNGNTSINAILTDNITVNDGVINENSINAREWIPVASLDCEYEGNFDGNGKTISGLYVNDQTKNRIALFGHISKQGIVENLTIDNSYFNAGSSVAAISIFNDGTVKNCNNYADLNASLYYSSIGGIVSNNNGTVENCHNFGPIIGNNIIGGIAGNNYGIISKCSNNAVIKGKFEVSAITTYSCNTIENCCNTGEIYGNDYETSFVYNNNANGIIVNCYDFSKMNFDNGSNSFVHWNDGTTYNCYYLIEHDDGYSKISYYSDNIKGKTAEQFASGEVAWLLGNAFGQKIGTDKTPVIGGDKVFAGYHSHNCCEEKIYSNTELVTYKNHCKYSNGICTTCGNYHPAEDSNGDNIYEIESAGELFWFAEQVNSGKTKMRAILTTDITLNNSKISKNSTYAREWTPIGTKDNPYNGYFKGNGKTISGLYINDNTKDYVGLFGCTGRDAYITDVNLTNSYICGNNYVGSLIGANYASNSNGLFSSANSGDVVGNEYVGGLIGANINGSGDVRECCNTGAVKGNRYVGGICGSFEEDGYDGNLRIQNCCNTGTVIGNDYVGGLSGFIRNKGFKHCYNVGTIISNGEHIGALIGFKSWTDSYFVEAPLVTNCYYLNTAYKKTDVEGEAKTALQFVCGEVAYLLQCGQWNHYWGQTIGKDLYPVLGGLKVYGVVSNYCSNKKYYSNSPLYGDVDLDGLLTINDATLISKYLSNEVTLTENQTYVADINNDGKISEEDVVCIQQKLSSENPTES